MQDERDDHEADQEQEADKPDLFDDLDEMESELAFRAWDLQVHAIDTIGELYVNIAKLESPETADVMRAVGHALVDLVEDHNARKIAITASMLSIHKPGDVQP